MAGLVCSQGRVRDEVGAMLHVEGSFWLPAGKKNTGHLLYGAVQGTVQPGLWALLLCPCFKMGN